MSKIIEYGQGQPIHDYSDHTLYTDHGDNRVFWAWEFIRRKRRYQELTDKIRHENDRGYDGSAFSQLDKEFYPWLSHWESPLPEWSDEPDCCPGIMRHGCAPWTLLHAGTTLKHQRTRDILSGRIVNLLEEREELEPESSGNTMVFAFDLAAPLEVQIEEVKKQLKKQQGKPVRRMEKPSKGDKGLHWLQLVDGLAVGADSVDIMDAIDKAAGENGNYSRVKENALRRLNASPQQLLGYLAESSNV